MADKPEIEKYTSPWSTQITTTTKIILVWGAMAIITNIFEPESFRLAGIALTNENGTIRDLIHLIIFWNVAWATLLLAVCAFHEWGTAINSNPFKKNVKFAEQLRIHQPPAEQIRPLDYDITLNLKKLPDELETVVFNTQALTKTLEAITPFEERREKYIDLYVTFYETRMHVKTVTESLERLNATIKILNEGKNMAIDINAVNKTLNAQTKQIKDAIALHQFFTKAGNTAFYLRVIGTDIVVPIASALFTLCLTWPF